MADYETPPSTPPTSPGLAAHDRGADRRRLQWATSRTVGKVSELTVMAPVRRGCVPGERRTYEERLRATIADLARRHEQGLPTELDRVSSIHFGRMMVIRPEQYLAYSNLSEICPPHEGKLPTTLARVRIDEQIDDYREAPDASADRAVGAELRSWLLILVEFDGDLKVYMQNIAYFLGKDFDNIFRNCEDYPNTKNFDKFWSWIRRFQIPTDLLYATYSNLSVARIKQLEAFKRRFDAFVDRVRSPRGPLVRSMDEMFDEFLLQNQQYAVGFPTPGGTWPSGDDRQGD
jgi:hypothetical protein